jgi:hypothetical protein
MNIDQALKLIKQGETVKIRNTDFRLFQYSHVERDYDDQSLFHLLHDHGLLRVCSFRQEDLEDLEVSNEIQKETNRN